MTEPGPLDGIVVLDLATLFAGPLAATILGDYGAEVIKVEHPVKGDPSRGHGPAKDGHGLWWKMLGRNKKAITCDLGSEDGARLLRTLAAGADVLIENFRPGTLERWGLDPAVLRETNPGLVVARVTGFGQFGPYARRPGFGTLAESMSGFAAATGEPGGPPTLPPFGLADGIAALTCVSAVMMALHHRERSGGDGQIVDLAIIEPLVTLLGPQPMIWDQLGVVQERRGNRSANNAPRNTYRTRDGRWVAVSTSSQNIAERVLTLVGHPEVIDEPWFAGGSGRARHSDLLDGHVGGWIAERDADEVISAFEEAQAAIAPVYDIRDVLADPQYRALDTVTTVDDPDLGPLRMQNVLFRLDRTPGSIRSTGAAKGAHNQEIYGGRLGLTTGEIDRLHAKGVL
ncbi:CaiB/BaiF CoA transferase family protein [Streptomyces sp. NPDC001985]|uniref:CaiB/BaiF CoA transferase family protein n=1 Tax=Streptomyces sp. NPDC001985 TaxID=3154406 RepID=UPI00332DE6D5